MSGPLTGRQTFELAPDAGKVQSFLDRHATRLTIDPTAITVEFGPAKSRVLRWDDPSLAFVLIDLRRVTDPSSPFYSKRAAAWYAQQPYWFKLRGPGRAFVIPEAAYLALSAASQAAGLLVAKGAPGRRYYRGTDIYVYSRKKTWIY